MEEETGILRRSSRKKKPAQQFSPGGNRVGGAPPWATALANRGEGVATQLEVEKKNPETGQRKLREKPAQLLVDSQWRK